MKPQEHKRRADRTERPNKDHHNYNTPMSHVTISQIKFERHENIYANGYNPENDAEIKSAIVVTKAKFMWQFVCWLLRCNL